MLLLVLLLVVGAFGVRAALPGVVHGWLVEVLAEQLNIDLSIDDIAIDLADGHVTLTGIEGTLDGKLLARSSRVDARLDVAALLRGDGGTISLEFQQLEAEIRVEPGGALNLSRIAPRAAASPDLGPETAAPDDGSRARIDLDFHAKGAVIRFDDAVTDPSRPVALVLEHATISATRVLVAGDDEGAALTDVRLLGAIPQDIGPALLSAGYWECLDERGRYLELHAALTAFDVRKIPQYVTPKAEKILGGNILHVAGTAVAHAGTIEQGLVEVEVEDSSSTLELKFGGPLSSPVVAMDSPVLEAFRLSYLRVADSGSSVFAMGKGMGESLWDRSSGLVRETAGGVGDAVSELSIRKLGEGIWRGITGLFKGGDDDDAAARIERWAGFAQRQLAFRELFMERRIAVAKKREPDRVPEFEQWLADEGWKHDLDALIPEPTRPESDK